MKYFGLLLLFLFASFSGLSVGKETKKVETIKEISIIGNSELPNTQFDLPWRLSSVDKREDQSPEKNVPGLVRSIEPYRYKQQIHFTKYLEVDSSHFNAR